jgi:hypothetical protein
MFQKVFFGKLDKTRNGRLPDLQPRELGTFVPLVIAIFLLGLFPRPLLAVMEPSVNKLLREFGRRVAECDGPPHNFGVTSDCEKLQAPAQKPGAGKGTGPSPTPPNPPLPGGPPPGAPTPPTGAPTPPAGAAGAGTPGTAPGSAAGRPTP